MGVTGFTAKFPATRRRNQSILVNASFSSLGDMVRAALERVLSDARRSCPVDVRGFVFRGGEKPPEADQVFPESPFPWYHYGDDTDKLYYRVGVPNEASTWGEVSISDVLSVEEAFEDQTMRMANMAQSQILSALEWNPSIHEWPVCPAHRHPLWPKLVDGRAVWQCGTDPTVLFPIGDLLGDPTGRALS